MSLSGLPGQNTRQCCAPNCKSIYYRTLSTVSYRNKSFFKILANRRLLWIESVRKLCKPDFTLADTDRYFCEDHFEFKCFKNSNRNSLNKGAVPTLFLESTTTSSPINCNNTTSDTRPYSVKQFINATLQNFQSTSCQTLISDDFPLPPIKKPKYTYSKLSSISTTASTSTMTENESNTGYSTGIVKLPVDEKIGNMCELSTTESQTSDTLPLDLLIKTERLDEEFEIKNEIEVPFKIEPVDIKMEEYEEESDTSLCDKMMNIDDPNSHEFEEKNPLNMYKCDTCDFKTKLLSILVHHQMQHQDSSQVGIYICDRCEYSTKHKSKLITHQLKHKDYSEVRMYTCDACDFKTKYKNSLANHKLGHKDFSEVEVYACDTCDYKTKLKGSLIRHQLKHKDFSEVQFYKCDTCDYKTKIKSRLTSHQLTHKDFSEVPIYKCNACDYITKHKHGLINHQLRHKDFTEVEMYKCDKCDFKTIHKSSLTGHQLVHKDFSEVELYKCELCDYKSKRRRNLIFHQLKHKDSTITSPQV